MQEATLENSLHTVRMPRRPTHGLRQLFSSSQKSDSVRRPSYTASYHLQDSNAVRAGFHAPSERSDSRVSAKGETRPFISGRETNALRGRSGSAPLKASIASRAATPRFFREEQMPSTSTDPWAQAPGHARTMPQMRIWYGHGRAPQPYPGLGQVGSQRRVSLETGNSLMSS